MNTVHFITVTLLSTSLLHSANSANIAFHGGPGEGSHFFVPASLGLELARRGHSVTAIISGDFAEKLRGDESYSPLHFMSTNQSTPPDVLRERTDLFSRAAVLGDFVGEILKSEDFLREQGLLDCDRMVNDEAFLRQLRAAKFDMMVMDPWMGCPLILPKLLDTPFALLIGTPVEEHIASAFGSPVNLAVYPAQGSGLPQKMSFLQRFHNVLKAKVVPSLMSSIMRFTDDYRKSRDIFPMTSTWELLGRAELLLVNMDFAAEYPVALLPNVITVGGITNTPPKPLPEDLENFVQSSGEAGVVVFSFGSYATYMKQELIGEFAEAFGRLPQKIVWKFVGDRIPDTMRSPQFKIMSWLPQNDLLAHEKVRAMVFHGGSNSFYEGIDHGVPTVVIPLLADQFDVASRVVHHGMGVQLDFQTLDADKITAALTTVLEDDSFQQSARRVSTIYHARNPTRPVEKAAFWVEHVIKHGGQYMKSPINELAWYQYHLLDVSAALTVAAVAVLAIVFGVLKLFWKLLCRLCCGRTKKAQEKNKYD